MKAYLASTFIYNLSLTNLPSMSVKIHRYSFSKTLRNHIVSILSLFGISQWFLQEPIQPSFFHSAAPGVDITKNFIHNYFDLLGHSSRNGYILKYSSFSKQKTC